MLEERQILLCLQETNQEVQKAILVEEQACCLLTFDGRDLTMELDEIHPHVDEIEGERAAEAGQLL
jgi:hypothetical protein